jgi:glucokinase
MKMEKEKFVAGIDIGGTNTVCGLVSHSGAIAGRSDFKTSSLPRFSDFTDKMAAEIKKMASDAGVSLSGAGIGAPNANYYTGDINNAANLIWKGVLHLKNDMEQALGVPVTVTNDANAAAVGEMIFGSARGLKHFIMLTLGTGVGSGIVADGKVIYGHTGLAGELGHLTMIRDGRPCGCGRKGCLEAYASATGIVRTAKEMLEEKENQSSLRKLKEEEFSARTIAMHAEKGDKLALEVFDFTAQMLAWAITNAVLFSSPEAIVLAGGLSRAGELITVPLEKYIDEMVMHAFRGSFRIITTSLPQSDAAILGAAALAIKMA